MKSAKQIEQEQSNKYNKVCTDEIYYFKKILSQCTDETFIEDFYETDAATFKPYYFKHYFLENGLHVYMSSSSLNRRYNNS